jgi:glycine/D-amino acid oxidase-like deaminating enzyme
LDTPRGRISAKKVVVATNAYTPALLPEFKDKITPALGVACRIDVPKGGKRAPHLNNTYLIRYGPQEYDYLISRTDGSIVVGGAKQAVLLDDSYWHNNTNDSEMIPGAEKYFDGYMQRMFHGWEESGAKVTDIWTGVMGYSSDLVPWVGEVPSRPGVYVIAGFTGHGMPRILGCSVAVASLVRGDAKEISSTELPPPYWITQKRLDEKKSIARDYMAGSRGKPSL